MTEPRITNDQFLMQDCLPYLVGIPDQSVDAVITDPPYPNGAGLFTEHLTDGIAALYLCAKKARTTIVFFWSPLVDPPRPPPGWFHTATHIWGKPDAKSKIEYELVIVWTRDYHRQRHRVYSIPILDYRTLKEFGTHPTQKPLRLMRALIETYTREGQTVLDPFAGTGTTAVACKHARRHYIAIESNPDHATFAQRRLQEPKEEQAHLNEPPTEPPTNQPTKQERKRR